MWMVDNKGEVVGLMAAGLVMLGTWPAVWNLVEKRGRCPSHVFLDYVLTYLVVAVIISLTLGQIGSPKDGRPNFLDQLPQPNAPLAGFAVVGGISLAIGDLCMQYSVAFLGLAIGPATINALTIIIGVVLNYFLDNGLNKAPVLFSGTGCAAVAIVLGALAHLQAQKPTPPREQPGAVQQPDTARCADMELVADGASDMTERNSAQSAMQPISRAPHAVLEMSPSSTTHRSEPEATATAGSNRDSSPQQWVTLPTVQHPQPAVSGNVRQRRLDTSASAAPPPAQPPDGPDDDDMKRSIGTAQHSKYMGLAISVFGGVIYSFYSPAFNVASNDSFRLLPAGVPALSIYATNFYFAASFTSFSLALNVAFLYFPPLGTQKSSLLAYLRDNDGRLWSILAGLLAVLGDGTQFMAGQVAGYAAATVVQAYPLVGTVWGVLLFREFRAAPRCAVVLLCGSCAFYLAAIGLLAASAKLRLISSR